MKKSQKQDEKKPQMEKWSFLTCLMKKYFFKKAGKTKKHFEKELIQTPNK